MRNFQILSVSAVKTGKECLQTASVRGGLCHPDLLPGQWTPQVDLRLPAPLGCSPLMKTAGVATDCVRSN